jgi:recombination protein RecA
VASSKNTEGEAISNCVRVRVIKNKVAPPFREADIEIEFGTGLNIYSEVFDLGVEYKLLEKSGSWITFPKLAGSENLRLQGKAQCVEFLKRDAEYFGALKEKVEELVLKSPVEGPIEPSTDEDEKDFEGIFNE